jgi:hypothetical protein
MFTYLLPGCGIASNENKSCPQIQPEHYSISKQGEGEGEREGKGESTQA